MILYLKNIRGLVCHDIRTIYIILASRNETFKQIAAHRDLFPILLTFTFSPFMHHVKLKRNSQLTPRNRGLSMLYFQAIKPIILLFHESRPEKRANHAITPTAGVPQYTDLHTWRQY